MPPPQRRGRRAPEPPRTRLPPEVSGAEPGGARSRAGRGGRGHRPSAGSADMARPPQKEIVYNKLLPYGERLEAEAARFLEHIKGNLARAVQLQELWPGGLFWTRKLST